MEKLHRKISYLEGLSEGLDLSSNHKEGRILTEVIQLCKSIVDHIENLKFHLDEQEQYIEAIDDDLSDVESFIFEFEEELENGADEDWAEDWDDTDEADIYLLEEDAYDDDENGYFEIECPNCEEIVLVEENLLDDDPSVEVICPECNEVILVQDEDDQDENIFIEPYQIERNTEEHFYSP